MVYKIYFLLGTTHQTLDNVDHMAALLQQNVDKIVELYVYNSKTDMVRVVALMPTLSWGGRGLLGAEVGTGYLHRLPAAARATAGTSVERKVRYVDNNSTSNNNTNGGHDGEHGKSPSKSFGGGRLELEPQLEMEPGPSEDEDEDEVESVALETPPEQPRNRKAAPAAAAAQPVVSPACCSHNNSSSCSIVGRSAACSFVGGVEPEVVQAIFEYVIIYLLFKLEAMVSSIGTYAQDFVE